MGDKERTIEQCYLLVNRHFGGSMERTRIWFNTENPILGNISPITMILYGREKKLLHIIQNIMEENDRTDESEN